MRSLIAPWLVLAVALAPPAPAAALQRQVRFESPRVAIVLDAQNGAILSIEDRERGTELRAPEGLAENWRLEMRLPSGARRAIVGRDQPLTGITPEPGGARLRWEGPLRDTQGGAHSVTVVLRVRATANDARFEIAVSNRSSARVAEISHPIVGGLAAWSPAGAAEPAVMAVPPHRRALTLPFGEFAPLYPGALQMQFVDVTCPAHHRGLYIGSHDRVARMSMFRFAEERREGVADIRFHLRHFPMVKPGAAFRSGETVFRFHDGDWREGGRFYREWFLRAFGMADPKRDWIRRTPFFQMTMIMLPEGNVNYRISDIPRLARDAKRFGVDAIQIAGWQYGGHDNGYPYYEPDPRLGTWADLRKAIAACHRIGVRVFFFVNLQPAMLDLEWYRRELRQYLWENGRGDAFWIAGWGMGTLASRMGLTTPLMAFLDVSFPRYADRLAAYFRKLALAGADGIHIDKMFPGNLNMNPRVTLDPDTSGMEGAIRLIARIARECQAIRPGFAISNECNWDRVLTYGTATWWAGNMSTARTVFPELTETVALYQPYDYQGLNNAVRLGHTVMVAPHHFNRSMAYPSWRGLAEYVRELARIRRALIETVFLGELEDGATARVEGNAADGSVLHSVFRHRRNGRRVVVLQNNGDAQAARTVAAIGGATRGRVRIHRPFARTVDAELPARVDIGPERLAFVEQLPPNAARLPLRALPATPRRRAPARASAPERPFANTDFEAGTLDGWTADPNWTVDDNSAGGWYSGWQGRRFAWSGRGGEQRTGTLRSPVFTLRKSGVQVSVAGWADIFGRTADRWNYVSLRLEGGSEIDRVYAPNTVTFTPLVLDARRHRGERAYLEVVDDASEATFSMICIDAVRLVDLPADAAPRFLPAARVHVLQNARYRVEVDRANGSIVRLRDRAGGLELIREPRLAGAFRFSLPIRGREGWQSTEANTVDSRSQRLGRVERSRDGLTLVWPGPLRAVTGRRYPVTARLRIALREDAVRFDLSLENRTRLEVGEVYYPVLGGWTGLGSSHADRQRTSLITPAGAGAASSRPFHTFANMSWLGVIGPEQFYPYPDQLSMPWAAFEAARGGRTVTIAALDAIYRYKVFHLEMLPGIAGARAAGNWPRPDELRGLAAGVRACWAHIAYERPGRRFHASPVVVRCHGGGARESARWYGAWLSRHGGAAAAPSVLASAGAFVEVGRTPYAELPKRAREAAAMGIRALLLQDWTPPEDDGVPLWRPDPALGGEDGLRAALAECRSAGVAVILGVRLQPVSRRSPWYRQELHRYVSLDRWGVPYSEIGWRSGSSITEIQESGERRVWLGVAHPGLRSALARSAERLARLGASGLHLSAFFGRQLDFNPRLPLTPDQAAWQGAMEAIEAMREAGARVRPGFSISLDEARDRFMGVAPVSRTTCPDGSLLRTAAPGWRPTVSIEPEVTPAAVWEALLKGALLRWTAPGPPPDVLARALREALALREACRETLAEGAYRVEPSLPVAGDVATAAFASRAGAEAIVIVNRRPGEAEVSLGGSGQATLHMPGMPSRRRALPARIAVPASGAVVVVREAP